MAGSIKWFEYETDTAVQFAVSMDESNGEAVSNTDYTDASTAQFKLPSNVIARYARYTSDEGTTTRKIVVGDPDATVATLPASFTAQVSGNATGVLVKLREFVGERVTMIPMAADTGLNDGDAT